MFERVSRPMCTDRKKDPRLQQNSFSIELFEKNINVPLQDVVVGSLLGRGGFGKVYKGRFPLQASSFQQ